MPDTENNEEVTEKSEENGGKSCKTGMCGKMHFCPVCMVIGVVVAGYFIVQFLK